jgi:uroporphyrinogen III methyltransferase/synthase
MNAEPPEPGLPLAGNKIVVTRARAQTGKLAERLESLGAEVIEFPTIDIQPVAASLELESAADFDWVVFTSANAVQIFADALEREGNRLDAVRPARICAVGPATADAIREHGLEIDLVPPEYVAESVLDALKEIEPALGSKRILLPRGDIAREFLPDALRALGADVTEHVVYRTARPNPTETAIDAIVDAQPDVVTFTSASTVRHYCEILGTDRLKALNATTTYASIGPQTTETAERLGLTVSAEPEQHDVDGLVAAIVRWFEN